MTKQRRQTILQYRHFKRNYWKFVRNLNEGNTKLYLARKLHRLQLNGSERGEAPQERLTAAVVEVSGEHPKQFGSGLRAIPGL